MNQETLKTLFELVLFPILFTLVGFAIKFLQVKSIEIQNKVSNETADKYIKMIEDTIITCVTATTQTYVDSLKAQGKFDEAAQKEAFKKSLNAILDTLSLDAINYIEEIYGDVKNYLTQKIEAQVKVSK